MSVEQVVVIIQARMGSTRLPGKVMMELAGRTVLSHVMERAQAIPGIDKVIVATSDLPADDRIVDEVRAHGLDVWRGSETDVLSRYYDAAVAVGASAIVRITSDCPLLDAEVSGAVVARFLQADVDYVSNTGTRRYPRGLDTEVCSFAALAKAHREAPAGSSFREHVTQYIYAHPLEFRIASVVGEEDLSQYRWTLDTPEDWQFIRTIYEQLYESGRLIAYRDVLQLLARRPELHEINAHIEQRRT